MKILRPALRGVYDTLAIATLPVVLLMLILTILSNAGVVKRTDVMWHYENGVAGSVFHYTDNLFSKHIYKHELYRPNGTLDYTRHLQPDGSVTQMRIYGEDGTTVLSYRDYTADLLTSYRDDGTLFRVERYKPGTLSVAERKTYRSNGTLYLTERWQPDGVTERIFKKKGYSPLGKPDRMLTVVQYRRKSDHFKSEIFFNDRLWYTITWNTQISEGSLLQQETLIRWQTFAYPNGKVIKRVYYQPYSELDSATYKFKVEYPYKGRVRRVDYYNKSPYQRISWVEKSEFYSADGELEEIVRHPPKV